MTGELNLICRNIILEKLYQLILAHPGNSVEYVDVRMTVIKIRFIILVNQFLLLKK